MAFTSGEKEEIRQLVDDHIAPVGEAVESLKSDMQIQRGTTETLAKALERLSLVVVGDEELKIVGYGQKIELIDKRANELEKQIGKKDIRETVEKTKVIWFVIGAAIAINVVFRLLPWGWAEIFKLVPHA